MSAIFAAWVGIGAFSIRPPDQSPWRACSFVLAGHAGIVEFRDSDKVLPYSRPHNLEIFPSGRPTVEGFYALSFPTLVPRFSAAGHRSFGTRPPATVNVAVPLPASALLSRPPLPRAVLQHHDHRQSRNNGQISSQRKPLVVATARWRTPPVGAEVRALIREMSER